MIDWWSRKGGIMRRRLGKFLPIVLIAVLVQIFAPIGATWATSIALSDPLRAAAICHGNAASQLHPHSKCFEPSGQTVPIGIVNLTPWQPYDTACHCFEPLLKHWPIAHR